jgi:hypothetical protein
VLRLYSIPVPEDDARRLIATLLADGGDIALSAAALITRASTTSLPPSLFRSPRGRRFWPCSRSPKGLLLAA